MSLRGGIDFFYRVVGEHVISYLSQNPSGKLLSRIPKVEPNGELFTILRDVVRTKKPYSLPITYIGPAKHMRKIDEVIMPLTDASGVVSHLLVFIQFGKIENIAPVLATSGGPPDPLITP